MRSLLVVSLALAALPACAAEPQKGAPPAASSAGSAAVAAAPAEPLDPNGLAYHLATNALARVAKAKGPEAAMPFLYSNGKWSQAFYQYKPFQPQWSKTCWLRGVQGLSATCLGYTNGHGGVYPITMISPRHYVASWHIAGWFPFCKGNDAAVFLDNRNKLHRRKSLQCVNAGNDIAVGLLDTELPPSVGFLPVLPRDYTNYLKLYVPVQGVGANQDMLVFSQPILFDRLGVNWNPDTSLAPGLPPTWSRRLRNGDSSFPERLLVRNQLVLVSCTTGIRGGANYAELADRINGAMHELSVTNHLSTDYQLKTVDLSGFAKLK